MHWKHDREGNNYRITITPSLPDEVVKLNLIISHLSANEVKYAASAANRVDGFFVNAVEDQLGLEQNQWDYVSRNANGLPHFIITEESGVNSISAVIFEK